MNFDLDESRAETFRMTKFENVDAAFFSNVVVLFEGESDDAYCKHVAKLMDAEWDFERKNISMVRVNGKGNFAKFRAFFEAFGITVKIVADLDALFDGYQHLGATQEANDLRANAITIIDERISELGVIPEPSARQIRDKINRGTWRERYETAKQAFREVRANQVINAQTLEQIDSLFTWEDDIARTKVCQEDERAAQAIVPLLDALRAEGICVLSRGAIEDYYPDGVGGAGPKPQRALEACKLVVDQQVAQGLSSRLADGRLSELEEVFGSIFHGA